MRRGQLFLAVACASCSLLSPFWAWGNGAATNSPPVGGTNGVEPWPTLVADYVPHLHGHPWPSLPTVRYVEIDTNLNIWGHPAFPKKFPTMQEVNEPGADFATVILRLPNGRVYKTYNDLVMGPYLAAVYSGDFNGDGVPDFFAIKPSTGCGIAGEQAFGVFAFSEGANGYRFTRVDGWGLGRHDLVIDPATKKFRFMHTTFCEAKGLDGRYHSFWVSRPFKWEDDSMLLDDHYPPVWVQFLFRPNHEPTKLLTAQMEAKAWAAQRFAREKIEW
jgi:hypothetical protein